MRMAWQLRFGGNRALRRSRSADELSSKPTCGVIARDAISAACTLLHDAWVAWEARYRQSPALAFFSTARELTG